MHKSAVKFALRHNFRLAFRGGHYFLVDTTGKPVDTPAEPGTARGACRMMRRRLRTYHGNGADPTRTGGLETLETSRTCIG